MPLICSRRKRRVGYIIFRSYIIAISLRYDFSRTLQQKIIVYNLVIWQLKNSFCIIDKSNNILYAISYSRDRDFGV